MKNNTLKYDLILQNGHVIDPANNIDKAMDVGIKDGKIAIVTQHIPSGLAEKAVDVSGSYVIPGIIDIHTHVYPPYRRLQYLRKPIREL